VFDLLTEDCHPAFELDDFVEEDFDGDCEDGTVSFTRGLHIHQLASFVLFAQVYCPTLFDCIPSEERCPACQLGSLFCNGRCRKECQVGFPVVLKSFSPPSLSLSEFSLAAIQFGLSVAVILARRRILLLLDRGSLPGRGQMLRQHE